MYYSKQSYYKVKLAQLHKDVAYKHLKLPTKRPVLISGVLGPCKKKKKKNTEERLT